jgi:hypothetical protein
MPAPFPGLSLHILFTLNVFRKEYPWTSFKSGYLQLSSILFTYDASLLKLYQAAEDITELQ